MSNKLRIIITAPAKADVRAIRDYIARDKPRAAAKWVKDCQRQIRSLVTLPLRFEVIPETDYVGAPFRHVVLGNYRIIYHVTADHVAILRVIRATRILTPRMLGLDQSLPEKGPTNPSS